MRRELSGLIAAFVVLAAPLAAQRGDTTVKPVPKTGAKVETKAPAKTDQTKQAPAKAPAKTDAKAPAKTEAKAPAKTDQKVDQSKQAAGKAPANAGQKTDQSKQAAPAAGVAKPDTGKGASLTQSGGKSQMTIMRELFTYEPAGRRDPMASLANTSVLRPLLTEVECIGILYDEEGRNSEAILRTLDKTPKGMKVYRVKVGQMLGRATVAQITRREVIFTIDEYGFSRQVPMPVKPDTSIARTP